MFGARRTNLCLFAAAVAFSGGLVEQSGAVSAYGPLKEACEDAQAAAAFEDAAAPEVVPARKRDRRNPPADDDTVPERVAQGAAWAVGTVGPAYQWLLEELSAAAHKVGGAELVERGRSLGKQAKGLACDTRTGRCALATLTARQLAPALGGVMDTVVMKAVSGVPGLGSIYSLCAGLGDTVAATALFPLTAAKVIIPNLIPIPGVGLLVSAAGSYAASAAALYYVPEIDRHIIGPYVLQKSGGDGSGLLSRSRQEKYKQERERLLEKAVELAPGAAEKCTAGVQYFVEAAGTARDRVAPLIPVAQAAVQTVAAG